MEFVLRRMAAAVRAVGRGGESAARHAGSMALLVWRVARATLTGEVSFRDIVAQAYSMGVQSIPLVCTTGLLSGVVTSQQGGYQFYWNQGQAVAQSKMHTAHLGRRLMCLEIFG